MTPAVRAIRGQLIQRFSRPSCERLSWVKSGPDEGHWVRSGLPLNVLQNSVESDGEP
jgi:hypothetical protein